MSGQFGCSKTLTALSLAIFGLLANGTAPLQAQTLFDSLHGQDKDAVYGVLKLPTRSSAPLSNGSHLNLQEFGHSPSYEEIFGSDGNLDTFQNHTNQVLESYPNVTGEIHSFNGNQINGNEINGNEINGSHINGSHINGSHINGNRIESITSQPSSIHGEGAIQNEVVLPPSMATPTQILPQDNQAHQSHPNDAPHQPAYVQHEQVHPSNISYQQANFDVHAGHRRGNFAPNVATIGGFRTNYQDNTPMRLGFQTDFLYFNRGGADDSFFVFDETTFQPLLRHSDLQFDDELTQRYRLLYQSQGGTGFEFQYFNFDNFDVTRRMSGVIPVFFGGQPSVLSASYDLTYNTEIKNHEVNAWVRSNEFLRIGIGGRYVDLREEFNITEGINSSFFATEGFFTDADNDLFGGQLLADIYIPLAPGLNLEFGGRAGIYHNNMDFRVRTLTRDIHYEDEALSTVFDVNAGLAFQVTPRMQVHFGYQAMFLNDVALGPSQSTGYDFHATSADAQLTDLTLDGGYFGAEFQF